MPETPGGGGGTGGGPVAGWTPPGQSSGGGGGAGAGGAAGGSGAAGASVSRSRATPKCPKGFVWSEQYKACIEVPKQKQGKCPEGYYWDPKKKVCLSRENFCGDGYAWSETYQTCIEVPKQGRCPEGYHWDAEKGVCKQGTPREEALRIAHLGRVGAKFTGEESAAAFQASGGEPSGASGASGGAEGGAGGGAEDRFGAGFEPDPNSPLVDAGIQFYFTAWGQVPPAGYIEGLVEQGMNLFEIQEHERTKPAYKNSPRGQAELSELVSQGVSRSLGVS